METRRNNKRVGGLSPPLKSPPEENVQVTKIHWKMRFGGLDGRDPVFLSFVFFFSFFKRGEQEWGGLRGDRGTNLLDLAPTNRLSNVDL